MPGRIGSQDDTEDEANEEAAEHADEEAHVALADTTVEKDAVVVKLHDADAAVHAVLHFFIDPGIRPFQLKSLLALLADLVDTTDRNRRQKCLCLLITRRGFLCVVAV